MDYLIVNPTGLIVRKVIFGTPSSPFMSLPVPEDNDLKIVEIPNEQVMYPLTNVYMEVESYPPPDITISVVENDESVLMSLLPPDTSVPDGYQIFVQATTGGTWEQVIYLVNTPELRGCLLSNFLPDKTYSFGVRLVYESVKEVSKIVPAEEGIMT